MSKIVKKVGRLLISPVLAVAGAFKKPKAAEALSALPTATRDDTLKLISNEDRLRRRRGGAADILTGTGGAEASAPPTSAKTLLGQ